MSKAGDIQENPVTGERAVVRLVNVHLGLARLKQTLGEPESALELIQRIEPIWGQLARIIQSRDGTESAASNEQQAELGVNSRREAVSKARGLGLL